MFFFILNFEGLTLAHFLIICISQTHLRHSSIFNIEEIAPNGSGLGEGWD